MVRLTNLYNGIPSAKVVSSRGRITGLTGLRPNWIWDAFEALFDTGADGVDSIEMLFAFLGLRPLGLSDWVNAFLRGHGDRLEDLLIRGSET